MKEKINVSEIFGSHVFNDSVMKARLPKAVYKDLKKTIEEGTELNPVLLFDRYGNSFSIYLIDSF